MRLTKAGEYAVRCILYLSKQQEGAVVKRHEIAQSMDIPSRFLAKIAQQLSLAGILEINQGPKGGFRLLIPPHKLTLLYVIESVIGKIFLNDCVIRPGSCYMSPTCSVYRVWKKAREQLRETLNEATFSELIEDKQYLNFKEEIHA